MASDRRGTPCDDAKYIVTPTIEARLQYVGVCSCHLCHLDTRAAVAAQALQALCRPADDPSGELQIGTSGLIADAYDFS